MNLKKRVKAIFVKPKRKLAAVLPELRQLRQILECVCESRDPLTDIVRFFDAVSRWYDRGGIGDLIVAFEEVNYGQYDEVLKKLERLQRHFVEAGRNESGMNRTKCGQRVTADRVFLGDIFGLWTHPIPFWKRLKDEKKGGWGFPGMEHLNAYDVVCWQARQFMIPHAKSMISIINYLEDIAK